MLVLSSRDVHALLSMRDAIAIVRRTMTEVSDGQATLPLRSIVDVGAPNRLGIMPGVLGKSGAYGVKLISLFPENPARGLSSHIGAMVLFDPETGAPAAMINADALTAIRTAAASAAATDALARGDARVLAIIGTGEQAEAHIAALSCVRDLRQVRVAGRTRARAQEFVDRVAHRFAPLSLVAMDSVQAAADGADIICTVTSSPDVVLHGDWVAPGTHVNAVGASVPTMQEIDTALLVKSRLFVDYRASALAQARDIIDAIASGAMDEDHILGEIGEVFAGRVKGCSSADEITLYRSLGIAAQDLACAGFVYDRALADGVGTVADIL